MNMLRCVLLIGALLLETALASSGLAVCCASAWAQAVTLAELEGSVIEVSAVHQETMVGRNGQPVTQQIRTNGHLTLSTGGTITVQFQSTAVGPWGTRVGEARGGTTTLGKAHKGPQGNDQVWLFSNGELRRLVAHHEGGAGGSMMTIALKRGPGGLRCSFSFHMARENGAGTIRKDAAIGNAPIEILEYKPMSSSCQVTNSSSSR